MARVMISAGEKSRNDHTEDDYYREKQQREGDMDQVEAQDDTKLNLQVMVYSLAGIVMLGLVAYLCWTLYKKKYPRRNIPQRDPSLDSFGLLTRWKDRKPTLNKPSKPDPTATDIDLASPASAQGSCQKPRAQSTTETADLKATLNLRVPSESSVEDGSVTSTASTPSASSAEEDRPSTPAVRKRAAPVIDSGGEEEAGIEDHLLGE